MTKSLTRDVVVLACAVSAGIHAALAPDHFRERAATGLGFAVSAVVLAVLAAALARSENGLVLHAAAVILGGLIVAYLAAVTTGVPGLVPEAEPVDALALVTKAIEAVGLAAAVAAWRSPARARLHSIPALAVVVACSALVALPFAGGGHDEHGSDHAHERAPR